MNRLIVFTIAATLACAEVPTSVTAELDLEKRSDLALRVADESLSAAAKAYNDAGEMASFEGHLATVEDLTRLSLKSLQDTGKRASQRPKYFKRAELKLRGLMRRMDSLAANVSVDDRPRVEAAKSVLSEAHEKILHDIMSKK